MCDYRFLGKYIIKANLRCITGLHIGGTDEGFEIGGVDNPVIKDPLTGYPYIPGSSLKGKIRSLLEWTTERESGLTCAEFQIKEIEDKRNKLIDQISKETDPGKKRELEDKLNKMTLSIKPCDCGSCDICIIFGCSAATERKEPTRLTVRDCFPTGLFDENGLRKKEDEINDGTIAKWERNLGEKVYTEAKTENTIDRLTSEANPRTMERVPADSVFEVEMIFDIYKEEDVSRMKKLFEGMMLLEDSSLGGGGSRGSGKVRFENFQIIKRDLNYYTNGGEENIISLNGKKTAKEILEGFDSIFK